MKNFRTIILTNIKQTKNSLLQQIQPYPPLCINHSQKNAAMANNKPRNHRREKRQTPKEAAKGTLHIENANKFNKSIISHK